MSELTIAAIICTYNRDYYLGAAIDSLLAQDCSDYEIIVVDNGSKDQTKAIVDNRLPHPRLKYVYEPIVGLSVARNRGARETQADILAYLDDDAEASPQWLRCLQDAYLKNIHLAIAGGKVDLIWPAGVSQPRWMSQTMTQALGVMDLGAESVNITNPNNTPRGVNYSVRRTFLEQVGGFDSSLGRMGKKLLSNEELYMTELALKNGWQVTYCPQALVHHNVSPERIKRSWFFHRSWWQGVSEYYRERISKKGGNQWLQGLEGLVRGLVKSIKYIHRPDQRLENLIYAYGQFGYLWTVLQELINNPETASANDRSLALKKDRMDDDKTHQS